MKENLNLNLYNYQWTALIRLKNGLTERIWWTAWPSTKHTVSEVIWVASDYPKSRISNIISIEEMARRTAAEIKRVDRRNKKGIVTWKQYLEK